ncbi:MAG: acyl-CoA synthetase FdrA [Spirochaetales bacterium]|nr:acyl-CoA synthetase FdrA [Spirochaetales bacterium]
MKRIILRKDSYYDSVFLMLISADIKKMEGISEAVVAMGTEMNLDLLNDMKLGGTELDGATANDLIIAIDADSLEVASTAEETVDALLRKKADEGEEERWRPASIAAAFETMSDANLVVISLPGQYAAREARRALVSGRHVMMFSDNVGLDEEVVLKRIARERGLLMMGPDCGTAIINGKPLCFANVVPQGSIGVVSASGTGLQEVTSLIAGAGGGVRQAIGTGGRDLKSEEIGGSTTLMAIEALAADDETKVIVVISKPPAPAVADKVISALEKTGKPAVVHLIGLRRDGSTADGPLHHASNLEEAALSAVALAKGTAHHERLFARSDEHIDAIVERETREIASNQRYLRGYFTGGTLTDEAVFVLHDALGGVHSFDPADRHFALRDPHVSQRHTIVDLGEDIFTVGRPHPMIDPSIRTERMEREAADAEVAVVILDCVIGYGSHPDPAGALAPAIQTMKKAAAQRGGYVAVVASVTGTEGDIQRLSAQRNTLEEAGAIVMPSNHQAARLAQRIMAALGSR